MMLYLELEQRANIKFLVKLSKIKNKIREMLVKIYRNDARKKIAIYKWVKHFSEVRKNMTIMID